MENGQKSNLVKTRKTFEGTTKDGKTRKVTIFMGQQDAQALLQAAQEAVKGPDGACLTVFIGESKFGKGAYTSIILEASTPSGRYQATNTQPQARASGPVGNTSAPKFAFKPKIATKA
jgi:hypothetical protein